MIQSIEIENFRAFESTKIEGFKRMNLFTGKNNSGKTTLLEAIQLSLTNNINDITLKTRNASSDSDQFKNIHFQSDENKEINLAIRNNDTIEVYKRKADKPIQFINTQNYESIFIIDKNIQIPDKGPLTVEFDNLDIKGKRRQIEESLKTIDENIVELRTYASKPSILYLRKKNEDNFMPIQYFGDAIQKVAKYIINILSFDASKPSKILLIDEIENGLHYSAHEEFWTMLFKLCIENDVQVFATTHSLEMIKSFQKVANEFENEAAYFELGYSKITNKIVAINHEIEVLEYEIESNETIRGE